MVAAHFLKVVVLFPENDAALHRMVGLEILFLEGADVRSFELDYIQALLQIIAYNLFEADVRLPSLQYAKN